MDETGSWSNLKDGAYAQAELGMEAVAWANRLERDERKVIILDDDPTGTQIAADVDVILRPSLSAFRRFFASPDRAVYVLTNTRALTEEEAVRLVRRIRGEVLAAGEEAGKQAAFVLRGDSTLRGHVFAESDVFAAADSVILFIPAFPEGGRITRNGIHYLKIGGNEVPVVRTEFARDTVFGYTSGNMIDWVAEVGQGRPALSVPLSRIRGADGHAQVARTLLEAPSGTVIVPDAETRQDLETIAWGLLDAESRGRSVVVRCAPTFAVLRAGLSAKTARQPAAVPRAKVLLVCGSHTHLSTLQLEQAATLAAAPVFVPVDRVLRGEQEVVVDELTSRIERDLRQSRIAVLATERIRDPAHGSLQAGARVMEALVSVVRRLSGQLDAVIAKGGITSAQVAVDGLSSGRARVLGQLTTGVSLWELELENGTKMPYVVIPGNVGDEQTIVEALRRI